MMVTRQVPERTVTMRITRWLVAVLLLVGLAQAQTSITFWHSMGGAEDAVEELVSRFNESQTAYRVDARNIGSYPDAQTRLIAAFGTADEPTLFQAEIGFFPQLVADGAVQDLGPFVATLDQAFVDDFYDGLWNYGAMAGGHYGLPWNSSTPVMYYNADALALAGVAVPTTWEDFAAAARSLTSRQAQGAMFVGDSWLFEMMVLSLGGTLMLEDGTPNLDSAESREALGLLDTLVRGRHLTFFSSTESTAAILTFIRTRNLMTFASIANWPEVRRFSVGFTVAAAPVPMRAGGRVPLGGAKLVVMRNASEAEAEGAFAFWQFLMEPEHIAHWVEASYYIPVRRAALPLLEDFYAEDANRAAAIAQLDLAVPRPRVAAFNTWRRLLDEALERTLRGGTPPEQALADAQRRALETR
jgi:sn-glycerol 3-phosphate transport system substrate-binding protein